MAQTLAALVQAVTASTGTNDYVLEDPASQGPLRTDVQAVADGSLSDGQVVHYMVRDTTVTGDASFEEGYGAYASATRTVSRTAGNVIDGSNGPGTLVVWGASGQRDFYILRPLNGEDVLDPDAFADNIGAARLNAANVFTTTQAVTNVSGIGVFEAGSERSTASQTVGIFRGVGHNAGGNDTTYADILVTIEDPTEGSEDGRSSFRVMSGGVPTERLRLASDGTLSNPTTGNTYEAFPSGMDLISGTVPTGYTRSDATQSRLIRLAKSGETLGATGGGDDIFSSWATQGHAIQISEMPSHTHDAADGLFIEGGHPAADLNSTGSGGSWGADTATASTGGDGAHSHNMTTPYYRIMARIVKS